MRPPVLAILPVLVCTAAGAAQPDDGSIAAKKRLAIVQFEAPREYRNTPVPAGITDMMITALVKLGSFEVIERAQIDKVIQEHDLAAEGFVGPHTAVKMGKLVGADLILGGKVTEFGVKTRKSGFVGAVGGLVGADFSTTTARAKIDCRLIDTTSGKVIWADTGEAKESRTGVSIAASNLHDWLAGIRLDSSEWNESRIGRAVRGAVDQIVGKLAVHYPPCGRVIGIIDGDGGAGSSVVIDLGTFQDFKTGDVFVVYREEAITNDAGEVIWTSRKKIGQVTIVEPRIDRSRAVVDSAYLMVREGDVVVTEALADKLPAEGRDEAERGEEAEQ